MLLGVRPKNHRDQIKRRGTDHAADDRRTPWYIFDPLHSEHEFTVDVAAADGNALCARFYDRDADGLERSWRRERAWCNPPYSDLYRWVYKALCEVAWGGCLKVVMLLPANRSEQRWWQELIEPIRDRGFGVTTRHLRGRPRFGTSTSAVIRGGKKGGTHAPFGCVLVIIEPRPTQERPAK